MPYPSYEVNQIEHTPGMEFGYVKLWRKTLGSIVMQSATSFQLFGYCLLKAVFNECDVLVGRQIIHLQPGQLVFGRLQAASDLHATESQIRTALDVLKRANIITTKTTNKFSIVSIVNWNTYQNTESNINQQNDQQMTNKQPADDQQMTNKQPADDQQMTTKKNVKNVKNNIYITPPSSEFAPRRNASTPPPPPAESFVITMPVVGDKSQTESGVPESWVDDWRQAFPDLDILGELQRARSWLLANPQNRKTKAGLRRFLNSWLGRSQNSGRRDSGNSGGSPAPYRSADGLSELYYAAHPEARP